MVTLPCLLTCTDGAPSATARPNSCGDRRRDWCGEARGERRRSAARGGASFITSLTGRASKEARCEFVRILVLTVCFDGFDETIESGKRIIDILEKITKIKNTPTS
jgi:hypothetical protein